MSYILDALRKAEAEKNPQRAANQMIDQQQPHRQNWGLYLIAAALIGNLTVLLWLFGPWSDSPPDPKAAGKTAETITAPQTAGSMPSPAESALPQRRQQSQPVSARTDAQPLSGTAPDDAAGRQTNLQTPPTPGGGQIATAATPQQQTSLREPLHTNIAGLPRDARARFPELSFSTHVFAADPELRAVVVNGERLREGDRLENMRLTNITETGVVFRFEEYFVSVSVLDDWD